QPVRRQRLRQGLPGREAVSRRQDRADLRGHVEPAAADHRQATPRVIGDMSIQNAYLLDLARTFRQYKRLGDGALAQVSDENLHTLVDPGANSIAIVMKHVAGNLRSRFTDFLTSDGEKPGRNRDGEFEVPA